MTSSSLPAFGPSCPSGGTWYACSTGATFVGCCSVNPCVTTCAQGNLYPASFLASKYDTFPDVTCQSGSSPYTCAATSPPFLGCCKKNPCSLGSCSGDSLTPATLGDDFLKRAFGAVGGSSSSSSSSSRTSNTGTTRPSSTLPTTASGISIVEATATKDVAATITPKKDGTPVAAIAGGAAGGALAVALIVGLVIYYFCHAKKPRRGHKETVRRQSDLPAMTNTEIKDKGIHSPEAPPGYVSPKPKDYYEAHAGQYQHQQQPHYDQYIPSPHELPTEPHTPAPFHQKPVLGHQRNISELSGETSMRPDLETPLASPNAQSQFVMPSQSPQVHGWQSLPSPESGSNWAQ